MFKGFKNFRVSEMSEESSLHTPFGYTPKLANMMSKAFYTCCVASTHVDIEDEDYDGPYLTDENLALIATEVVKIADLGFDELTRDRDDSELVWGEFTLLECAQFGKSLYPDIGPNLAQISIICALFALDSAMEQAKTTGVTVDSLEALSAIAMALSEAATESARDPLCDRAIEKQAISTHAKRAADGTHVENRRMKAQVFQWCDENMHKYKSRERAAQAVAGKIVPVMPRTVYEWMVSWKKNKQYAG